MNFPRLVKPRAVSIKGHAVLNERWIQTQIDEDPSILGLGDLIVRDRERIHPSGGRLDLLCQEPESGKRYEIEIQLGKTDESHIVRTIEYWDQEKKRYPQYEHTAVIVAEDITSRFLNVIALFNGYIPIVALQMRAFEFEPGTIALVFTKVLDERKLGLVDEDEAVNEPADRDYWEKRGSKGTLALLDECVGMLREIDPTIGPKYNKHYVGLARSGQPDNFVVFHPKKNWLIVKPRLDNDETVDRALEDGGLEGVYRDRDERYRITVDKNNLTRGRDALKRVFRMSFENNQA